MRLAYTTQIQPNPIPTKQTNKQTARARETGLTESAPPRIHPCCGRRRRPAEEDDDEGQVSRIFHGNSKIKKRLFWCAKGRASEEEISEEKMEQQVEKHKRRCASERTRRRAASGGRGEEVDEEEGAVGPTRELIPRASKARKSRDTVTACVSLSVVVMTTIIQVSSATDFQGRENEMTR
uniref:Uncharacterized protein n=1 Tax=Oryza sativa subsp. japonica TaxID=39947 RepID=Q6Z5L4_ORYSJ|nr:hypothetical protein [Oryza sativa Japonica Group]